MHATASRAPRWTRNRVVFGMVSRSDRFGPASSDKIDRVVNCDGLAEGEPNRCHPVRNNRATEGPTAGCSPGKFPGLGLNFRFSLKRVQNRISLKFWRFRVFSGFPRKIGKPPGNPLFLSFRPKTGKWLRARSGSKFRKSDQFPMDVTHGIS